MQAPAGIAMLRGPEHRFEWVNPEYELIIGRSGEALIGKTILEAMPEVEGQFYLAFLNGVYRTGKPFHGHESLFRLGRADGGTDDLYLNFVYLPTRSAAGETDGIFVYMMDVTSLVAARMRVEESEQRFRQLADSMPQMVWTARPDGSIDYYNQRWYEFTGFDLEQANQSWFPTLHPEEAQRVEELWNGSVQSGEPFQVEARMWDRHEGRWRWVMGRAVAVRDASGKVVKWFGTCTDIDEQKTSQQAMLQAQKLESVGLLAGGIAHDFNNLLVGIMGGASFALESIPESHPAFDVLQTVVGASERAAHLTRQMLAYARKGNFIVVPVDLSEMVMKTTQFINASVPKSVQVQFQLASGLPTVQADPGGIQQVVMNLIINAAEAVGEKSGRVMVRTRAERIEPAGSRRGVDGAPLSPGDYAVLEVEDSGCGIEPSILAKIFDPFFSTKFAGRGLGLAAVGGVIRSHRGAIEVDTETGKGSTFRVLLPASQQAPAAAAQAAGEIARKGEETILVIDDEEVVRHVAQSALGMLGYQVIVTERGAEGLDAIRQNTAISLVLLDMSMPGLSGKEVLEALRKIRPDLPVIVCSGYSEGEVFRQFSGLKMDGVLQKPFTNVALTSKIRSVLDAQKKNFIAN
jgi:PAS domain S-box-containing protein